MRAMTIELSGHEVYILKQTIDVILKGEVNDLDALRVRVRDIERILFGAGP